MSKGKPVLKRFFPRQSSPRRSHQSAFFFVAVLILLMAWVLFRIISHDRSKTVTSQKPKSEAALSHTPVRIPSPRKPPTPPESIVLEKDSMTFPGTAPRLEHKTPVAPSPLENVKIDWSKPAIAFVIDDIGHETTYDNLMDQLGSKITYAILPHLKFSNFYGQKSLQTGADVILHLPLESEKGIYPGPGLITRFMPEEEIRRLVAESLDSIPHQIGANNHMGSLGTSDSGFMEIILEEFKKRNLFFLDSYTSPRSQVVPISRKLHLPVLRRDVFLDNVEKSEAIHREIERAAKVARRSGFAIAIGHYKKHTLEALAEEIPRLEKRGYQIVKLSELMKRYN